MRWQEGYIAVDWGTTNRRAYRVAPTGQLLDQVEDGLGIRNVPDGNFKAATQELRARLGALPLLLAGMIGSNIGWKETPYAACPAGLAQLKAAVCWIEPDMAIVPGVCFTGDGRADVMRGEELQVLGVAAAELVPPDAVICHPGTHTKWVRVMDARIVNFKTSMTGEMFALLRKHSILAGGMQAPMHDGVQFAAGVRRGLEQTDLLAELFSVRARSVIGRRNGEEASDFSGFVSGLLIGSDVREAMAGIGTVPVSVVGEPHLTTLYAQALKVAGHATVEIDGARAFLAGANAMMEML